MARRLEAIAAVDGTGGLGAAGKLLFHLPSDLSRFKSLTTGNIVVMGRRTLESLPGAQPLPHRLNIVLTHTPDACYKDCRWTGRAEQTKGTKQASSHDLSRLPDEGLVFCESRDAVLGLVEHTERRVFVCGGEEVYRLFLDDIDCFHLTEVDALREADAFLPDLEAAGLHRASTREPFEECGVSACFVDYERHPAL